MNSRLEALIKRGYSKEDVVRLSSYTKEELDFISNIAFNHIKRNCTKSKDPFTIFIGGQPGCGKSILSMNLKNKLSNAIEIGIDNYRMYHPNYLQMEKCIKEHWKNRLETENDTPGNDIADFTHLFAGEMTDKLIELGKSNSYNMILEWGMREADSPIKCMNDLKNNNYKNIVVFVATPKKISYDACVLRSSIMKDYGHIIRKVPKSFHDYSIETLPDSINKIYESCLKDNIIDYMSIVDRNNNELWNNHSDKIPGDIFNSYVNSDITLENSDILSLKTNKKELIGLSNDIKEILVLNNNLISENKFK